MIPICRDCRYWKKDITEGSNFGTCRNMFTNAEIASTCVPLRTTYAYGCIHHDLDLSGLVELAKNDYKLLEDKEDGTGNDKDGNKG